MGERRVSRWAAVAVIGMLIAACGGNPRADEEFSAADQARAEMINLRARDLRGWAVAPAGAIAGQAAGEAVDRTLEECLTSSRDASVTTGDSSAGVFRSGALMVTARVRMIRSEAAARADLAALRTPRAAFCLKQAIETASRDIEPVPTSVDQTTTTLFLSNVSVERLDLGGPEATDAVAMRARAGLQTISGGQVFMTSDRIAFVKGRAFVVATFMSATSFPTALERQVLATLASRA